MSREILALKLLRIDATLDPRSKPCAVADYHDLGWRIESFEAAKRGIALAGTAQQAGDDSYSASLGVRW